CALVLACSTPPKSAPGDEAGSGGGDETGGSTGGKTATGGRAGTGGASATGGSGSPGGAYKLEGVATWRGDKTAAFSVIHDDVCDPSVNGVFKTADPELVKRDLHGGFGA